MGTKNYWTLKNRPHTKLKLDIYKKYLDVWCSIFEKQKFYEKVFVVDCFAGRGNYEDETGLVDGSPLITVRAAKKFQEDFLKMHNKNKSNFRIYCIFIEDKPEYVENLNKLLLACKDTVDFKIIAGDFNVVIDDVLKEIGYSPALFFIDPFGIKTLKRKSVESIVTKKGAKDILLNYIQEGIERIGGLAKKCLSKKLEDISVKEIKTIKNLNDFMGNLDCIGKEEGDTLKMYVEEVLKGNNKNVNDKDKLDVLAFDMPYPNKSDAIYYLLFASRNKNAVKIVSQVYAKSKQVGLNGQKSLFDVKSLQKINKNFKV